MTGPSNAINRRTLQQAEGLALAVRFNRDFGAIRPEMN
jgi:hypothetical protein